MTTDTATTRRLVRRQEFVRIAARIAEMAASWAASSVSNEGNPMMTEGSPQRFVGDIRDLLSFIDCDAANSSRSDVQ